MDSNILNRVPWMRDAPEVEVLEGTRASQGLLRKRMSQLRPCVIRGGVSDWPALTKWCDKAHLMNLCGQHPVTMFPHESLTLVSDPRRRPMTAEFKAAIEDLFAENDSIVSVPGVPIPNTGPFSELLADIDDSIFRRLAGMQVSKSPVFCPPARFFMYKGGGSAWHHHPADETLLCQVVNCKDIGLVSGALPPRAYKNTSDAFLALNRGNGNSFDSLDVRPETCKTRIFPGDVMYIPPHWWHGVQACDDRFGVSVAVCRRSSHHVWGNLEYGSVRANWGWALKNPSAYQLILKRGIPGLTAKMLSLIQRR